MDPLTLICGIWGVRKPRRFAGLIVLAAWLAIASCAAHGQDKKKADPAPVIFPVDPSPPAPPTPPPGTPVQLGTDTLYLVRSSVECVVIASPAGILKVTKDAGPMKIRAKFYGGDGTIQTKNFDDKWLYSVETLAKGTAELIVIPPGAGENDIIRKQIVALDGPQPPPAPPVPPTPPAPTDPLTKALQAAYDAETNKDKAAALAWVTSCYKMSGVMVNDTSLKTYGDLFSKFSVAVESKVPKGTIPLVQKVIGADVNAALKPTTQTPLDRAATQAEFDKIAKALAGVK